MGSRGWRGTNSRGGEWVGARQVEPGGWSIAGCRGTVVQPLWDPGCCSPRRTTGSVVPSRR